MTLFQITNIIQTKSTKVNNKRKTRVMISRKL